MSRPLRVLAALVLLTPLGAHAQQPTTVSAPMLRIAAEGSGRPLIGRIAHAVRMPDGALVVVYRVAGAR